MNSFSVRVLRLFNEMGKERLDLHTLFEAGGNEPAERSRVLNALDDLVSTGMVKACGSDFYELTERGKREIAGRSAATN
jgi:DNA-binding IclR family transcriptional regulator